MSHSSQARRHNPTANDSQARYRKGKSLPDPYGSFSPGGDSSLFPERWICLILQPETTFLITKVSAEAIVMAFSAVMIRTVDSWTT